MKNYLTLCERGNGRSVALAMILKDELNCNALAAGTSANPRETIEMLCDWADYVLVTDGRIAGLHGFESNLPDGLEGKLFILDVGPDRWADPMHPELKGLLRKLLAKSGVSIEPR